MTAIEALDALQAIAASKGDTEADHSAADSVLIEFLRSHDHACKDVADAWENCREVCGFWYA